MNFFKKPKIEFWCTVEGLEKLVPVVPAKEYLPEWWKSLSKDDIKKIDGYPVTQGNIKKCPAVVDLLLEGWILPMWTDVYINVTPTEIEWKASDENFRFESHSHSQFIDVMPPHLRDKYYWIFKPLSPWLVKTSYNYKVMSLNPFYFFNPIFDTAEGIQNSNIFFDTNPILLIKKLGESVIKRGTPLCIYIPIKNEKIDGKVVPYNKKTNSLINFKNLITKTMFSSANSYNLIKNKKCPFG